MSQSSRSIVSLGAGVIVLSTVVVCLATHLPGRVANAAGLLGTQADNQPVCRDVPNGQECVITNPDVSHPYSLYPSVTFTDDDLVTITAFGCVQTGGHGQTWKRYVDPQGPDSATNYFGTVYVPGLMPGEMRLAAVNGIPMKLRTCGLSVPDLYLHLGYRDEAGKYDDNGYDNNHWDPGTGRQCVLNGVELRGAKVTITVEHHGVWHASPPLPMDLDGLYSCGGGEDLRPTNLLPVNPRWGWQRTNGALPDPVAQCANRPFKFDDLSCSTQRPRYNAASLAEFPVVCDGTKGIDGHINWFPAIYTGTVSWTGRQFSDGDHNFLLTPTNRAGLTTSNGETIEIEFDARETTAQFSTPFWFAFDRLSDIDAAEARKIVNGRPAIVAGLVTADCVHDCKSEIHPVYALAFRSNDDPRDETWQVFLRNVGNEGLCSTGFERFRLPGDSFTFDLPWNPVFRSVEVLGTTELRGPTGASYSIDSQSASGRRVAATLRLGSSKSRTIHGEIHLRWYNPGKLTSALKYRRSAMADEGLRDKSSGAGPEELLNKLVGLLPALEQRRFADLVRAAPGSPRQLNSIPRIDTAATASDTAGEPEEKETEEMVRARAKWIRDVWAKFFEVLASAR